MVVLKITKFLMSCLKLQVSFSLNFQSLFSVTRDNSSVLCFRWKCTWFGQKVPIKVQNFTFLTALVKFTQICNLIGSFCWKYIKMSARKVQRSYVSWHWRLTENLKKKWFLVSNMTRIWWVLIQTFKKLKNLHFDWFLLCKVFDLKKYRGVIFHDTEEWCKLCWKTDLCFQKWHEESGKFSPEHSKL